MGKKSRLCSGITAPKSAFVSISRIAFTLLSRARSTFPSGKLCESLALSRAETTSLSLTLKPLHAALRKIFSEGTRTLIVTCLAENRPLNVAVIGCGSVARAQHIPNIVQSQRLVLHTCVDLDDAILAECRDFFGALHIRKDFEGAVNDPEVDMICLATTEKIRLPVIALAA